MNKTFEVTFSIINEDGTIDSSAAYLTTVVNAFQQVNAEAMIRGQYRNVQIHSCYQKD